MKIIVMFLLVGAMAMWLGSDLAQAIPTNNNGNHYAYGQDGDNGDNGNHYGWYKNGNDQSTQNTGQNVNKGNNGNAGLHYSPIIQASNLTQTATSTPEPATVAFLGAGLAWIGIWRRMSRKV